MYYAIRIPGALGIRDHAGFLASAAAPTVDSKKLEEGPGMIYDGCPSSVGFGVGRVIFQLSA